MVYFYKLCLLYVSGFGYFVVTPDTFRLHAEDQLASTWNTAWTHLHPMYIPAAFSQPQRAPMRSISCQVDVEDKPVIGQNESGDLTEVGLPNSNAIQVCRSLVWPSNDCAIYTLTHLSLASH